MIDWPARRMAPPPPREARAQTSRGRTRCGGRSGDMPEIPCGVERIEEQLVACDPARGRSATRRRCGSPVSSRTRRSGRPARSRLYTARLAVRRGHSAPLTQHPDEDCPEDVHRPGPYTNATMIRSSRTNPNAPTTPTAATPRIAFSLRPRSFTNTHASTRPPTRSAAATPTSIRR